MTLLERISQEYLEAYKSHDELVTSVLRLLKTAIKNTEINKKAPLTEEEIISVIKKEIKQREQAIAEYERGGNQTLAEKEKAEAGFLAKYLPEQLSPEEIKQITESTLTELGISDSSQTGRAIGAVMAKVKGKADGTQVARIVSEILKNKS